MNDREQQQRERAYKIWEDEGRPEGAHVEHWKRAEAEDAPSGNSGDVTKANDRFNANGERADNAAEIRPPSTVAPD